MTLIHWDDVAPRRSRHPGLGGDWIRLGEAAGSIGVGVNRVLLGPHEVSTPAHAHGADEEIFFVLNGAGLSWQDGETYAVAPGDTLVHAPHGRAHTLRAGEYGLDVLAFGPRSQLAGSYLPQVGAYWLWPTWTEAGSGANPFDRDQKLEWPDPSERPASIVHVDAIEARFNGRSRALGAAAGATLTGLNLVSLPGGEEGAPPHCHTSEEELFVVLAGGGELELWPPPDPQAPSPRGPMEAHPLRPGHVVSRPPGTRVPHSFRAGPSGLTYLAYGTRDSNDVCWYPRSNKVFFRGLGVIARLELLDYFDGEPA
ncbi:MAG TPA: cupin domain-containing protein [Candidatus Binatia bacterium]|nr:cupin domain-containing protein [Candidatus Binatia bacterium]